MNSIRALRTALALAVATPCVAAAQRGYNRGPAPAPYVHNVPYDGRFTFVRLMYTTGDGGYYYRGLPAWAHGYATAEFNLTRIMREVSSMRPHVEATNVLAITNPDLAKYTVAYMTEAGYWQMTDAEAVALRNWLLKGGFLILDDTRDGFSPGNLGWSLIEANFQRVFPNGRFADLTAAHPIFHSFFEINSLDIVPQDYDRGRPVFRALSVDNDPTKRIMVLVNFNTDVSNYWEFSAQGFKPINESNEAYKLGVNYMIYALTR